MHMPEEDASGSKSSGAPAITDQFGRIESRGIDRVPVEERHGQARELFAVWAGSNTTYLYILLGGALVGLGLTVGQAMAVVCAGNAFWLLVGLLSISGPASGTPSSIVMRAMFGILGNRLNVALTGCAVSIAYEAINLCIASLAGFALLTWAGLHPGTLPKLCLVVAIAAATLTISVYGHATIVRLSVYFTIILAVCVAMLAACLAPHVNLHFAPPAPLHGWGLAAAFLGGVTIIASGPLSWGTAADYARYLPPGTPPGPIILWTFLGGFIPSILLGALGVLAATAVDMTDPQLSFAAILPAWFYPVFLLVIVMGATTNNVLTAYSSGLSLQSLGIAASRSVTVLFDGFAGIAISVYALFISDFLDTLNNILALSVCLLGPSLAIYGADILMRGNRYDGIQLHDETPQSPYWYNHGFNWAGLSALGAGTAAALLCANTKILVGPVSTLLDGTDMSSLAGPVVAVCVYVIATRRFHFHATQSPQAAGTSAESNPPAFAPL